MDFGYPFKTAKQLYIYIYILKKETQKKKTKRKKGKPQAATLSPRLEPLRFRQLLNGGRRLRDRDPKSRGLPVLSGPKKPQI